MSCNYIKDLRASQLIQIVFFNGGVRIAMLRAMLLKIWDADPPEANNARRRCARPLQDHNFRLTALPVVAVADHAVAIKHPNYMLLRPVSRVLLGRHDVFHPCFNRLRVNQVPLSCYES